MINESLIIEGDSLEKLKELPTECVDCCVTSPPYYGLRDYGVDGQIGLEETPEEYIQKLVDVFREVKRVLKDNGTLWITIGDSYNGYKGNKNGKYFDSDYVGGHGFHPTRNGGYGLEDKSLKPKDLIGIPWMLAFALREDGWYLRQDIIWSKPNPMPESVKDRCTKSHEYIFLLSKSPKYYFDSEAIQEDAKPESKARYGYEFNNGKSQENFRPNSSPNTAGMKTYTGKRNKRDVWSVVVKSTREAHFATFPEELIKPCILSGSKPNGIVLDPFFGSGTTGRVATELNRKYIGIELNPEYIEIAGRRTNNVQMSLFGI